MERSSIHAICDLHLGNMSFRTFIEYAYGKISMRKLWLTMQRRMIYGFSPLRTDKISQEIMWAQSTQDYHDWSLNGMAAE